MLWTEQKLQADLPAADVQTVTVGAILVVNRGWAAANPNAHLALLRGIEKAMPTIDQRVSGGLR